jgi:uncharacterized membrane protein
MTTRRTLSQLQHDWLAAELAVWRQAALISSDQAAGILGLYETAQDRRDRNRSWLIYTLVGLAAVLFGAAALLLVGYNWYALPAVVKLAVVFGTIVATYALGLYLRYYRDARWLSEAVILLGCLFYGAGIWLVAQIFHMSAHYPDGVFWWAIGVLPLALLLDSLLLHALLVALVALWCGMEIINFPHLGAWFFGQRWPLVPNGCYLVLPIVVAGLFLAYRRSSLWRASLYVPLLVWWAVLQPLACRFEVNPIYFMGAVGALLLVLAESHRQGSPLAIPYRAYGALLFGGVLIPMSFWNFNEWTHVGESAWGVAAMSAAILVIAAATFSLAEWLRYRYLEQGERDLAQRIDEIRRRQWLPLAMVALMVGLSFWNLLGIEVQPRPPEVIWIPVLAANAAMVALSLWLMWVGLREERGLPFAAGVIYFLTWTVIRYIDLFGDMGGMLGAALLFFLCGCALLGVVFFWRQRKKVQYV